MREPWLSCALTLKIKACFDIIKYYARSGVVHTDS